jgi:hypothetical protein
MQFGTSSDFLESFFYEFILRKKWKRTNTNGINAFIITIRRCFD